MPRHEICPGVTMYPGSILVPRKYPCTPEVSLLELLSTEPTLTRTHLMECSPERSTAAAAATAAAATTAAAARRALRGALREAYPILESAYWPHNKYLRIYFAYLNYPGPGVVNYPESGVVKRRRVCLHGNHTVFSFSTFIYTYIYIIKQTPERKTHT